MTDVPQSTSMKGVDNKYVELLMATFEKYRNVESLVRTPSPSAEPGSPLKEKEQVQDIEDVFQAQNSCKYKVHEKRKPQMTTTKANTRDNKPFKEIKHRKWFTRTHFSSAEDKILLEVVKDIVENEKVEWKTVKGLSKVLNRSKDSVAKRIDILRGIGKKKRTVHKFSREEDFIIIDKAVDEMRNGKMLREIFLKDSKDLADTLKRVKHSIYNRWNAHIKAWLLQHRHKTLNLDIKPMLANVLADNFPSVDKIDWNLVFAHPEFLGHTEESLKLQYQQLIKYVCDHLKVSQSEVTLKSIAEFATERYKPRKIAKNERRQMELVNYFEKQVKLYKLHVE